MTFTSRNMTILLIIFYLKYIFSQFLKMVVDNFCTIKHIDIPNFKVLSVMKTIKSIERRGRGGGELSMKCY